MLAKEIAFIERFKARASHAAQVQSRVKKLDKIDRVEPPEAPADGAFEFQPAPRSGEDVVPLKNVTSAMAAAPSMRGSTSRCAARSAGA
jgi:ATPase subunit of ABC transporter with duplicated ATPase domains